MMEAMAMPDATALPSCDMVARCCRGPTRKNELQHEVRHKYESIVYTRPRKRIILERK